MATVAIIGGGFAGMASALFLRRRGIQAAIYETRDETYTSGGNIALAPNALRVLDHLGIYEKIRLQGFNYEEMCFANGAGATLGAFLNGSQNKYNYKALRVPRTKVRNALREACIMEGIEINYGARCAGVVEDRNGKVTVSFADYQNVTADFVIGADGIHSHIRNHLAPDAEAPHFSGLMDVMGHVDEAELNGTTHSFGLPAMLFGATGSFAIMPSSFSGDDIGYFSTFEAQDRSREEWDALDADKEELKKMLEDRFVADNSKWSEYAQVLCKKTPLESLTCWPFFQAPQLEKWISNSGRVILIGDAAHAIPPTGGQGAAMALEDAETLAYVIAETLSPLQPEEDEQYRLLSLASKWNSHRHARVAKVLDFTTKNGALRKTSPHFYEQAAKEWLIWAAFKLKGEQGSARWMYEYAAESIRADLV